MSPNVPQATKIKYKKTMKKRQNNVSCAKKCNGHRWNRRTPSIKMLHHSTESNHMIKYSLYKWEQNFCLQLSKFILFGVVFKSSL